MPNWVTVNLKTNADVLKSFMNDDGNFDFEKIIAFNGHYFEMISLTVEDEAKRIVGTKFSEHPMLRALEMSSRQESKFDSLNIDNFEELVHMLRNYKNSGFFHQMDFAIEKWGTKWNACESVVDLENGTGSFQTAWSCPEPLLIELSLRFPDKVIEVEYADEDIGSNCGTFSLMSGKFIVQDIAPNYNQMTDEERLKWKLFAYKVTGRDPKDYEDDEDQESED